MFSGDDALKKIEILSGGEKSRVLLGKILANPCHLLLLDEPTNHLDMESCEGLIDAINEFQGSVIMVTHNEEMLHSIATKLIIFDRDKVSVFDDAYQDFLEKTGWEDESSKIKAKTSQKISGKMKEEIKKLRAELIQEKSRVLRPLEEQIKHLESSITKKEEEFNLNTQQLVEASEKGNISFLAEGSKLNKTLQTKIESLYTELTYAVEKFEKENERFRKQLEKLEDNNPKI
jgi:ATP-binding cassette subfamily F protein 3